jgi:hypothetical protein
MYITVNGKDINLTTPSSRSDTSISNPTIANPYSRFYQWYVDNAYIIVPSIILIIIAIIVYRYYFKN